MYVDVNDSSDSTATTQFCTVEQSLSILVSNFSFIILDLIFLLFCVRCLLTNYVNYIGGNASLLQIFQQGGCYLHFFLQNKWLLPISHSLKTNLRSRGLQVKALTTIEVSIND